jgi:hypothetical protein
MYLLLLNGTVMDEKRRPRIHTGSQAWTTGYNANWTTSGSTYSYSNGVNPPIQSIESTASRGHAWPSAGQAKSDIGGNFTTSKIISLEASDWGTYESRSHGRYYKGSEFAHNPHDAIKSALGAVAPSSELVLQKLGTTAIAKCIPTNPVADAGTFIGELKSGLPKLVGKELFKTKMKDYRKVGSEYLNVEFGWKPLISDLQSFGKAAIESEKIINQLHRDSGKNVRRKYTFPDEVARWGPGINTGRVAYTNGFSLYPYLYKSPTGTTLTVMTEVTTKTWFSGCFTYHLNLGNTLPDRLARHAAEARKLYGVELTPATVWNLAPWSWAADWEGNIGDVLHNVSRFSQDGLVMRYGYIMQEKTCVATYTLNPGGRLDDSPYEPLSLTVTAQSKVRRRATPFGFGFDMTALTGRQSAILGALGISRGPRHL